MTTPERVVGDGPVAEPAVVAAPAPAVETVAVAPVLPPPTALGAQRRGGEFRHFALRNRKLRFGVAVVGVFLLVAAVGPLLTDLGPWQTAGVPAQPPSPDHWFGTTLFGQDVFTQFIHGLRATFVLGTIAAVLSSMIAMTVGFVSGYRGGIVDEALGMLTNIVLVLPTLAVLIIIGAYFEARSIVLQAILIGLTCWPWAARAIRAQTFSLVSREFVDMARLSGQGTTTIIVREIAPNMSSYLFMKLILLFGGSVLVAASLDFIGLGPTEGISLGLMMNHSVQGSALHLGLWWWFVPPGLAITAIVGALYFMNVGLDEVFNPRLRKT